MADFKFTNEEARKEYEEKLNALKKIVEDNSVHIYGMQPFRSMQLRWKKRKKFFRWKVLMN